jgi:hypothetical protein
MECLPPEAAAFEQLRGDLVFQLARLARGLVLQAHGLLDGRHLLVGKFAGSIAYDGRQWAPRYKQVDKIAAESIGGAAQCVQADPVSGFRLF